MKGAERNFKDQELSMETMLAFLKNELSAQEAKQIELQIQRDPLHKAALEQLKLSLDEDPDTEEKAYRYRDAFVKEVEALRKSDTQPGIYQAEKWSMWSVAAMILLLLLPLGYFMIQPPSVDDPIREEFFTAMAAPSTIVRGAPSRNATRRDSSKIQDLAQIKDAFHLANRAYGLASSGEYKGEEQTQYYEIAIREYEQILAIEGDQVPNQIKLTSEIYAGVAYLMLGKAAQALPHLQIVIDNQQNKFVLDAQWYKAWALLDQGESEAAKDQFYNLANHPGKYQENAQKIVQRLD